MKRNFVLIICLALVLVMAVSIVSAGWFSGSATSETKKRYFYEDQTKKVRIGGETYTVELVSCSDTAATIKVTSSDGISAQKEISEATSKMVGPLEIELINAQEKTSWFWRTTRLRATVLISVGERGGVSEEKSYCDDNFCYLYGGEEITKTLYGNTYTIELVSASDSAATVKVTNSAGESESKEIGEAAFKYVNGISIHVISAEETNLELFAKIDFVEKREVCLKVIKDNKAFSFGECHSLRLNDYVIIVSQEDATSLRVSVVNNQTMGYNNDKVKFTDVFSSTVYEATLSAEGTGTLYVKGNAYDIRYSGPSNVADDERIVSFI